MANFEDILNKPASEIKHPPPYPIGTYHCLVDGPPAQEESSQKKTPCHVYKLKILSPMGDVDAVQAAEQQIVGKYINGQRSGAAFYLTEDAMPMYKDWLVEHLGIEMGNKSMKELIAEAPGRQVLVKLKHDITQDGKRVFHRVDSWAHV